MASKSANYLVLQKYQGKPLVFEGGDSGGGNVETLPNITCMQNIGMDSHNSVPTENSTDSHYLCGQHGCGFTAKSPHGLARHTHAKHGFGTLGKGLLK